MAINSIKTTYYDPEGNARTGYVLDGKTYTDAEGKNRLTVGSVVPTEGGTYMMTANGGVRVSGDAAQRQQDDSPYFSAEQMISDIYAQQRAASEAALAAAYDQNVNSINALKQTLPSSFQEARNKAAAQSDIQRVNFNEYAAANGLSSGTGGQAQLAFSNNLQDKLAHLDSDQSNAAAQLDLQLANLSAQYKSDIAKAIAEGDLKKALAQYDVYLKKQDDLIEQNQNKDQTAYDRTFAAAVKSGIYEGMAAFGWSEAQIDAAHNAWLRANAQ